MSFLLYLLLNVIALVIFLSSVPLPTNSTPIVAKLTHRDAVSSPFHKGWETKLQRQNRIDQISLSRLALLSGEDDGGQGYSYPSGLVPSENGLLFVNITMGLPPVSLFVFMDTASSLFWVFCDNELNQRPGIFNRFRSTTFRYLSCTDPICKKLPKEGCLASIENWCLYDQWYTDGAHTTGVLATEQVLFQNLTFGMTLPVDGIVFGCSFGVFDHSYDPRFAGVLGLGPGSTSLLNRVGPVFSYCLGNVKDENYAFHHLILMEDIDTTSNTVSKAALDFGPDDHYYLNLTSITMPGQPDITLSAWQTRVILDTGSERSWFPDYVYQPLRYQVDAMARKFNPYMRRIDEEQLCYYADLEDFRSSDISLALHFDGGSGTLKWEYDSIFYQAGASRVCLSITPSSARGQQGRFVIGLLGQQYHKFSYNLDEMVLYIDQDPHCDVVAI